MSIRHSMRTVGQKTLSALLVALLVVSCSKESPDSMVASAKQFLAKNDQKAAVIQLKNALQARPDLAEARYLLGKALLDSGDPTGAEVELRKARELNHPDDQVVPVLARAALMLHESEKVIKDLAKIELTGSEAKADLQTTVGHAYMLQGKTDLAEAAYHGALATHPGFPAAVIGETRLKASRNDLSGALVLIESALEKEPKMLEAWLLKGDLLLAQGNAAAALAAYRKALEVKPDSVAANSAVIRRLLDDGKTDDAGKQLDALKQLLPNHPQTHYLAALMAYQQSDFTKARDAVQQMLKLVPEHPLGLQLAGTIEYELKAYPQAEAYLLKALPKTSPTSVARRVLIATYLRKGQPNKALSTLEPILDKIDNDSNLLAIAGQVFIQNGQIEKAGQYFSKASALDPKNAGKRTSLAMVNLAKGDAEGAFRDLEQVAAADSSNKADLALIAAHLQRREFDQALKAVSLLEKKQPDQPLTHNLRGTALLGKRDAAGARKSFEKALSLDPAYFPAAANLARLDITDKKPEEAKKRFESVLAKDPKSTQAYLALAEIRGKYGGTTEEVAAVIGKAVTAGPTELAPRLALIDFYLGKKEFKSALSAAHDAAATIPDRPEILDAAGRAETAAGDYNQALATYGKLAALRPDTVLPLLRMAEVEVAAKNKDAAMQDLQKALKIKPDSLEAQRGIIMLNLDAGRVKEAILVAREVQRQRPKEPVGYLYEGDAYATRKAWSDAVTAYRAGLKEVPGNSELAVKLHAALRAGGSGAEADRVSETWLKDNPKDTRFRLYLAEEASGRKDYAFAIKQYRVLLDAQPDNPAVLNNLAWVAGQIKDPKALEYAEKANRLAPNQPALMDTLAVLLVEKGDKGDIARALELFSKVLATSPQAAMIRLNYAKALIKAGQKSEARTELEQLAKLGDKFSAQAEVGNLLKGL